MEEHQGGDIGPEQRMYKASAESGLADHKLLWHEATAGFHLLEDEVCDQPPVLLLALTHQPQRAVVHLNDHLHEIKASISDPGSKVFCYFHLYFIEERTGYDKNENDHLNDGGQDENDHLDEGHLSPVLANDGLQGADGETAKDFRNLKFKFNLKRGYLCKSSKKEIMFMYSCIRGFKLT